MQQFLLRMLKLQDMHSHLYLCECSFSGLVEELIYAVLVPFAFAIFWNMAAGLLLWARPAGNIDRLLHGAQQRGMRRASAGSTTLSAYVGGWTQTHLHCAPFWDTEGASQSNYYYLLLLLLWLVAWHSGRTSVSGRRTFPVLRSTCSDGWPLMWVSHPL